MPDMESRISELERYTRAILAELGSLTVQFAHLSRELDETKTRISTQLNNMAQNAIQNRRRIAELEAKLAAHLAEE